MPPKNSYEQKIKPATRYLELHFKEALNLNEIAEKAFLSPYHFHRVFKAVNNETVADFLRRLKLEYAAQRLFYNQQSVTELALELGFSCSQSFAKSFRKYFGISATDIRQCLSAEQYSQLIQDSKIGHLLRKKGHVSDSHAPYDKQRQQQGDMTMQTQTIDNKYLAYIRVTGQYGKNYEAASGKLYQWATSNQLEHGESIFIYHDNPELTPPEKCRTDICIAVPANTQVIPGIELKSLPAGKYAFIRHTVTAVEQYAGHWNDLMKQIIEHEYDLDERPCFEQYFAFDRETRKADVGFYVAIK